MKSIKELLPFEPTESKAIKGLAMIISFRMLGLFMLLPVLSLYAENFSGSTPLLIGLAIGIYGLTQAVLQIPFGMASDKFGRKKIIVIGLIIFALGSVLAAVSDSINSLIVGRALQGAGAISAVSMALLADLTREEVRVRAMGALGITIGFSFVVAIVLGPFLSHIAGVSGLFWFTTFMAVLAIAIVVYVVPNPPLSLVHSDAQTIPNKLWSVLSDKELLRLDFGIFALHMALTASFIAIPHLLTHTINFEVQNHGWLYLTAMALSVVFMIPAIIIAESKDKMKPIFLLAVTVLAVSQLLFFFEASSFTGIAIALIVFFIAFNVLESILPSLISKIAPVQLKGTAMGVYSSAQFFGAFVGGVLGGWLIGRTDNYYAVFLMSFVVLALWVILSLTMKKPNSLATMILKVGTMGRQEADALSLTLLKIAGVKEAVVMLEEGVVFVRVKKKELDQAALLKYSTNNVTD